MIAPSALFAALLPEHVVAFEAAGRVDEINLLPAEAAQVAQAREKRRLEFAAGRACAKAALAQLRVVGVPLLIGADRAPVWPDRVVGSITHTTSYCAAAVASREHFSSIGIDAEMCGHVGDIDWRQLFTPEEASWLDEQSPQLRPRLATLIFSAKESFFKAQFPLTGEWLDFTDVSIRFEATSFAVRPCRQLRLQQVISAPFLGKHGERNDLVATAIVLRPANDNALTTPAQS